MIFTHIVKLWFVSFTCIYVGRQWKASPSVHNLSESVPNVSHVHSKVPPQKVNCADHSCLGDGFHDTDDENELGHIRDYMQRAGKVSMANLYDPVNSSLLVSRDTFFLVFKYILLTYISFLERYC